MRTQGVHFTKTLGETMSNSLKNSKSDRKAFSDLTLDQLTRRQIIKTSVSTLALGVFSSCDDESSPGKEESEEFAGEGAGEAVGDIGGQSAGDMAGETAGDGAGETAGDGAGETAGDGAGETAGDMAGENVIETTLPEPMDPPNLEPDPEPVGLFPYSVASGDPRNDSVTLWTALDQDLAHTLLVDGQINLQFELTTLMDDNFSNPIVAASLSTGPETGFTVKTRATGLEADQKYRYRFTYVEPMGEPIRSHIGFTRTTPIDTAEVNLAVCSCANYSSGYFHAYRYISLQEDLHAVIHLGDYIYESPSLGDEGTRQLSDAVEADTLERYRKRYAEYRMDLDLQAMHRAHPVIAVWDDHEFDNNAYSEGSSNTSPEDWPRRAMEAKRAYHEWLPTDVRPDEPIYRKFVFGELAELFMLDTRIEGRSKQLTRSEFAQRFSEARSLLGEAQETWLHDGLRESTKTWKLLGQQVMMSPLQVRGALQSEREQAILLNPDQWDGYVPDRDRLYEVFKDSAISGAVVLTGDIHTSWASELSLNPNDPLYYQPVAGPEGDDAENPKGGLAIELVTPGITSRAFAAINEGIVSALSSANPHFKWFELTKKGFIKLNITNERLEATWSLVDRVDQPELPGLIKAQVMRCTPGVAGTMRLQSVLNRQG